MALFPIEQAQRTGSEAVRAASPWVEWLARLGLAARGLVYIVVGGLAALAAADRGGGTTDARGALLTVLRQPLGQVLLGVLALGLFGYALWRLVQAALDPEHARGGAKRVAARAGFAISGLIHGGLALEAARMALTNRADRPADGRGAETADHWAEVALAQPFGQYLLGAVGIGIVAFGLFQLYRAYTVQLGRQLDLSRLRPSAREWTIRFGRAGLAARGLVFGVVGVLLLQAARSLDPREAVGMAGALRTLQEQQYGPWLLGGVAAGLVGYGLFELVKARYRRIRTG